MASNIRLLFDENFDRKVMLGIWRRVPEADLLRVQEVPELVSADDRYILEWAAQRGYIIVSHDTNTLVGYANQRLKEGLPVPGVFIKRWGAPIGPVIDHLVLVIQITDAAEWVNVVRFLPV